MDKNISFTLKVWRQKGPKAKGAFETYQMKDIPGDTSFLEMLDILNEQLISEGKEPVVFDHDCREGICGMCSLYINGHPHGPATGATTCQIYMRRFNDGDTITVEPWRSAGFPVIKDLMVDRTAYDKIMQAGGYVSVRTGAPQDANAILIAKPIADEAMDAASCIGCGACVAACKNGSAMLFVSAKVSQLNCCRKVNRKLCAVQKLCCQRWMNWVLVTVQTLVLVKLNVRRIFLSATSLA